ncbi:MAG: hypothetical protein JW726_10840 [Anaerolineales bacterium]|nr:hypothetical protein [Anaerolineales bacterium]
MDTETSPSIKSFIPATLMLLILGWGGMVVLVVFSLPTVLPRWLFFFLGVLAFTGSALPIVAFLNQRFPSTPAPTTGVVLRQSIWFGIYGATLAWLQMGRVLTPTLAILLAVGIGLLEFLLRLSERSQWKPSASEQTTDENQGDNAQ